MKLYTEIQMKSAFIIGMLKGKTSSIIHPFESFEMYISDIPPIELPSDEEIKQYSIGYSLVHEDVSDKLDNYLVCAIHIDGAMWLKKQILNQNK